MARSYTWAQSSGIGAIACDMGIAYFQAHGFNVADLQAERFWQRLDVDLSVEDFGLVEVKGDTYTTGNVFLEVEANAEAGRKGWALYTQADYVLYIYLNTGKALLLPTAALQEWIPRRATDFPRKVSYTHKNASGFAYHSVGHTVPLDVLVRELEGAQLLTGFPTLEKKGD
jgi:hypothetical protein